MSKPELKNGLIGVVNTCITCCGRTETAEWLSSILSDLDAEPPKPTGEPAAFKRPCSTCGHQGNIFATYLRAAGFKQIGEQKC